MTAPWYLHTSSSSNIPLSRNSPSCLKKKNSLGKYQKLAPSPNRTMSRQLVVARKQSNPNKGSASFKWSLMKVLFQAYSQRQHAIASRSRARTPKHIHAIQLLFSGVGPEVTKTPLDPLFSGKRYPLLLSPARASSSGGWGWWPSGKLASSLPAGGSSELAPHPRNTWPSHRPAGEFHIPAGPNSPYDPTAHTRPVPVGEWSPPPQSGSTPLAYLTI